MKEIIAQASDSGKRKWSRKSTFLVQYSYIETIPDRFKLIYKVSFLFLHPSLSVSNLIGTWSYRVQLSDIEVL